MKLLLLLLFVPLSCCTVIAQGLCDLGGGGFNIDKTEGCAPLVVNFNSTVSNAITVGYAVDYDGKGTSPALVRNRATYTYAVAASPILLQFGSTAAGEFSSCRKLKIYESNPVVVQYTSCGGGSINLAITDNPVAKAYDQIEINWGDGSPVETVSKGAALTLQHQYTNATSSPVVQVTGIYSPGTACPRGRTYAQAISFSQAQLNDIAIKGVEMRGDGTIRLTYQGVTAIPTDIQYSMDGTSYTSAGSRSSGGIQPFDIKGLQVSQVYSLKLSSTNLCAGARDSEVVNSMVLSGKSADGSNELSWNQYGNAAGFEGYDLIRDGAVIKSFSSLSDITYTDTDVQCGSFSEYQIMARIKGVTSASAPVGIKTEIATPKPIREATVSVDDEKRIKIEVEVPGAGVNSTYDLTIERAESGSAIFRKVITLYNQNVYEDIDVRTSETSYCYRFSYQNSCGQKLPVSQPICSILLKKQLSTLLWTSEKPMMSSIASYDVIQTGTSGDVEVPVQLTTFYTVKLDAQSDLEYSFRIRANAVTAGFASFSNPVRYRRSAGIFIPDAFSPNGDGYNDVLQAKSEQLRSFEISVLNRWGQVVFNSDAIGSGWDGTINGVTAPVGSYVYRITFVDDINQTVEKSGTFMLLR